MNSTINIKGAGVWIGASLTKFWHRRQKVQLSSSGMGIFMQKCLFSQQPHFQDEHHIWSKYFLAETTHVFLHNGHLGRQYKKYYRYIIFFLFFLIFFIYIYPTYIWYIYRVFLAVTWQLYRFPCHSLTDSLIDTFEKHYQRELWETCDPWDMLSERWGDMTWQTKRQWQWQWQIQRQWQWQW